MYFVDKTKTHIRFLPSISLRFFSLFFFFSFFRRSKGESNKSGRRSVWPDNVKVFKGGNKEVLLLTCEGGPLSVYSNPRPVLPGRPSAAAALLSQRAGQWMTYIPPV